MALAGARLQPIRHSGPRVDEDLRVTLVVDGLVRTRATVSQQGLGALARRRNVTSTAFAVHPWHRSWVEGRQIVLLDDVLTTGATANACARALLQAGARAVDVLTLARTDRLDRVA